MKVFLEMTANMFTFSLKALLLFYFLTSKIFSNLTVFAFVGREKRFRLPEEGKCIAQSMAGFPQFYKSSALRLL